MLRIQRSANGRVVFTLSGRIEAEDVKEFRQLPWRQRGSTLVLDLRDVTLVNQGSVKFLADCEADSIKLASFDGCTRRPPVWENSTMKVLGERAF